MNPSVIGADVDACFAQFSRRIGELVLQSEANRARVCALGGAELLSRLLERAVDDAVLEGTSVALSNLSLSEEGRSQVEKAGGLNGLVTLLGAPVGDAVLAAVSGALRNLACGSTGRSKITELGGIEKLVSLPLLLQLCQICCSRLP
jgi:hypothetical protein